MSYRRILPRFAVSKIKSSEINMPYIKFNKRGLSRQTVSRFLITHYAMCDVNFLTMHHTIIPIIKDAKKNSGHTIFTVLLNGTV